ncbi:MAG: hydrogenase expression/formation protein HypE [Coriobacteriales bacterium]|jgi:hydrogenase expression/formation protein HypE|nr:hydrogenase expression/formation protein HypE [Coriobacteriales bacterium]
MNQSLNGAGQEVERDQDCVLLAHGSGGAMMHDLIEGLFLDVYGSDVLKKGDDAAMLALPPAVAGVDGGGFGSGALAFSTDTFVVTPRFFPGGDIGRLAVCGTVNDVATSGAQPLWLSVAFVLEEGFSLDELRRICTSIAATAREAGVQVVTGDTKVVSRGQGDGIYINTSGVGILPAQSAKATAGRETDADVDTGTHTDARPSALSGTLCQPGDRILISGTLGDHGIAIISCRENLSFSTTIKSDVAPLNHLIAAVLEAAPNTRCFRDPTRGGIASTLNELAHQSNTVMTIDEEAIPVRDQVRGACEMLGYDVLQVANEGKMVCVVPAEEADAALVAMHASRYGADAALIGEVTSPSTTSDEGTGAGGSSSESPRAYVRTAFGSKRILDMLVGEQLPRIC